ncbi:MAG: hypothetical protein Q8O91_10010, partial [Candidatus Aminicenantes bacterium]|nr:hypothetical protein [Candidatus Aminicenantes bacterium]
PASVPGVLFSDLDLKAQSPSIMDMAPTVLQLFGLEAPAHMDGRSLLGMLQAGPSDKKDPLAPRAPRGAGAADFSRTPKKKKRP